MHPLPTKISEVDAKIEVGGGRGLRAVDVFRL